MMMKLRNRQRGFTLIELLIVIAIIGIIAALLIPNFLDALNKAKQKRTMGDMKDTGTAWMSWLTDLYGAAAAAGATQTVTLASAYAFDNVVTDLQPQYIQEVKQSDAWNHTYAYCRPPAITDVVAQGGASGQSTLGIASRGRDTDFQISGPCGATITAGAFDPTDYDQDLVWSDGFFLRYPQKNIS